MEKKVMVINRAGCTVFYELPELRASRVFRPYGKVGDRMEIYPSELQSLAYTPGGKKLLDNYLVVESEDVRDVIGIVAEPEYFYSESEIIELLKNGTMDQLLDCLDYAPAGVLDLVKKYAIDIRLDSSEKRRAISERLSINLDAMIKNDIIVKEASKTEGASKEVDKDNSRKRRSEPVSTKK